MDLLVLGGTHHVGRCVVEAALDRGWTVTTLNRGTRPTPGVELLRADRLDPDQVSDALGDRTWDAVVDTWSGAPAAVRHAGQLLARRAGHLSYVSSRSVYRWPIPPGLDEHGPVVDGDAWSLDGNDYARAKRGGELAAVEAFGERALLHRAGLILGPYEVVGRLPWWLRRLQRGGQVLCPGPPDRPLQYVDGRDLAAWVLDSVEAGRSGIYNTVSRPGHTTMRELLEAARATTGGDGTLVWADPEVIEAAGIAAWTELPIWVPPEGEAAGLHTGDTTKAHGAGLTCRPVAETVEATWRWLRAEGDPPSLAGGSVGLSAEREAAALRAALRR